MGKRKWTRMMAYEPEIIRLREAGLTRQEIADELGLNKIQIKNWINRHNQQQKIRAEGEYRPKGRPRKDGLPPKQNIIIYRHWEEYPVAVMCRFFEVSRSGYYDYVKRMGQPEHDAGLAKEIEVCQNRTDKSYGITPSMSRKGNPYDNAMAENFFSILKTECIYRHKLNTFQEANDLIDRYIPFYNHERIQTKTGVAPLKLRHSA